MSGQRQDYLLREIARLRALVAALLNRSAPGEIEQALQQALNLQVRLFPLPAEQFLALDTVSQFERLIANTTDPEEQVNSFVELLVHTATLYDLKGLDDLGRGARQHALHLALLGALELGSASSAELARAIRTGVDEAECHPPLQELWRRFDAEQR
jgi:hypothetical protein